MFLACFLYDNNRIIWRTTTNNNVTVLWYISHYRRLHWCIDYFLDLGVWLLSIDTVAKPPQRNAKQIILPRLCREISLRKTNTSTENVYGKQKLPNEPIICFGSYKFSITVFLNVFYVRPHFLAVVYVIR